MMKSEQKTNLPEEYYKQFRQDILTYLRSKKKTRYSYKVTSKPKLKDYVIDPLTNERVCVFNDKHKDVVRTGHTTSQNLKMRWWCWDCKVFFSAYDYKKEADIVEEARAQVEQERSGNKT